MTKLPHYVTVTAQYDRDGEELTPDVEFRCPWLYGECHFYPACGCEYWESTHFADYGPGHERVHHGECWAQGWFDAGHADYTGPDADDMGDYGIPRGMKRTGEITLSAADDYVYWRFTEDPRS